MKIGDLLAVDRWADLGWWHSQKPLCHRFHPEGQVPRCLQEILGTRDGAARHAAAWGCWLEIVTALRTLSRNPPPWWSPPPYPVAKAIHVIGVFGWAPPVARQIAPGGPLPYARAARNMIPTHDRHWAVLRVFRFWAEDVEPGAPEDAFLEPGEVTMEFAPGLERLVCPECSRLMPLTPSGRFVTRARCARCQAAKDHAGWKAKDPNRARDLWRKASNAYRCRVRGDKS